MKIIKLIYNHNQSRIDETVYGINKIRASGQVILLGHEYCQTADQYTCLVNVYPLKVGKQNAGSWKEKEKYGIKSVEKQTPTLVEDNCLLYTSRCV